MLLDYVVAGACRHVITIGPDGGPGIIGKERSEKFVAIIFAKRIFTRAHCIADRERSLSLSCRRRAIRIHGGVGNGWRNELEWIAGLRGPSYRTRLRRVTRLPYRRLIGPDRTTSKDRHYDQPTASQLIVTNDRVTVVARFALTTKSCKHCVGHNRAIQDVPS